MSIQKYSVNQHPINTLLSWITSKEIAIPEIQRPFVWSSTQVRDLIDSLYQGYPVGYLIVWRNHAVRLKDGSISEGKRILIDGQQRITALMTSILGMEIITKDYKRTAMKIAFNPLEKRFEVRNPAIEKDKTWVADISEVWAPGFKMLKYVNDYCYKNDIQEQDEIFSSIELLKGIVNNHIGVIELNSDLDIETITEIFIRINAKGAVLSQADFAMSKIAANEACGGHELRKTIDYFCHLAVAPEFFRYLRDWDSEFTRTDYFKAMSWLRNENDDIYDPSYTDMLRVAFTYRFKRGKLQDLVALLSGRNFATRDYEVAIEEESFKELSAGIMDFMNETNFKKFVMIIRSAGFLDSSMIRSQNALNFAYIIYLTMRSKKERPQLIESVVRRWYVMSVLTGRYSSSPESSFDFDIKRIDEKGTEAYLEEIENAELSSAFWESGLPLNMNTSVASSPYFKVYLASQAHSNDKGFLSKDINVRELIEIKGDVHHIFPRNYLKKNGLVRSSYNQIANYVIMQTETNISIGDKAPEHYFSELWEQCGTGQPKYGTIVSDVDMKNNLSMHCIPHDIADYQLDDYDKFLGKRRQLMSLKIRDYYQKL
ncbi:MAG: DUF262 domain-containing protein [Victivallales bacterium]|nr:DUF262 domain-containing protein [Victivallales bacterium]